MVCTGHRRHGEGTGEALNILDLWNFCYYVGETEWREVQGVGKGVVRVAYVRGAGENRQAVWRLESVTFSTGVQQQTRLRALTAGFSVT